MKIDILNSDKAHPINPYLDNLCAEISKNHIVEVIRDASDAKGGDLLFLVSCTQLLSSSVLKLYSRAFVLHASDLPKGRGWSPHIWTILNGEDEITVTLLAAEERVDTGDIFLQRKIKVPDAALWNEINHLLFKVEVDLMRTAVLDFDKLEGVPQDDEITPTYFRKRTPDDSELDIHASLASQFNKMRICDPNRFPAFFELHGVRFKVTVEKV